MSYKNIRIGDLAASFAFRLDDLSHGSIKKVKFLLLNLVHCISIIRYSLKFSNKNYVNYVYTPEPTYVAGCYSRSFGYLYNSIIDNRSPIYNFQIVDYKSYLNNKSIISKLTNVKSKIDSNFSIDTYFYTRFYKPKMSLDYLEIGFNDINNVNFDDILKTKLRKSNLTIVLFLQTVFDGQYLFGINKAFTDLYDWAEYTINFIKSKYKDAIILIKPHPNISNELHPGDANYLKYIKKNLNSDNVFILDKNFSPYGFNEFSNIVGITIHGTVVDELIYLGIPVISSSYSIWGADFEFTNPWGTKCSYDNILSDLHNIKNKKLKLEEYEIFIRWIYTFRYNMLSLDTKNILKALFIFKSKSNYNSSSYISRLNLIDQLDKQELENFILSFTHSSKIAF